MLRKWLESVSKAQITVRNSCIPGTTPGYLAMCLDTVLEAGADLILVEYTPNVDIDNHVLYNSFVMDLEKLVQRLLRLPGLPAVVLVNSPHMAGLHDRFSHTMEDLEGAITTYYGAVLPGWPCRCSASNSPKVACHQTSAPGSFRDIHTQASIVLRWRPATTLPPLSLGVTPRFGAPAPPVEPPRLSSPLSPSPVSLARSYPGVPPCSFASLRLATIQPTAPSAPVDAATTAATRERGLLGAMGIMRCALAEDTWQKQQSAAREFAGWLASFGEGSDLMSCTPEDVLIYVMEHLLLTHFGRKRADGKLSPNGLKAHLSAISGFAVPPPPNSVPGDITLGAMEELAVRRAVDDAVLA